MSHDCRRVCTFALFLIIGCGSGDVSEERLAKMAGGSLKDVVPVSGKVLVDGSPESGVNIYLHSITGGKPIRECRTDLSGEYCWSTYKSCDGIEPGQYKLVFRYVPVENKKGVGKDLLNGRYNDPLKSKFSLTVEEGTPQSDIDYELSTK